jgi:serine/threonine protein kinase
MAYEMLSGALPFEGSTAADYQSSVLSGRFTPIESRLPGAPPGLGEFFDRAFALDPARRQSRAPELVADLERALA